MAEASTSLQKPFSIPNRTTPAKPRFQAARTSISGRRALGCDSSHHCLRTMALIGGKPADAEVASAAKGAATSSPDGRYLVFMSERNLAGAETADPESGQANRAGLPL